MDDRLDPRREGWLREQLGSDIPSIAGWPNCLVPLERLSVYQILEAVFPEPWGVWGEHVAFDEDGSQLPFSEAVEDVTRNFSLWRTPENQAEVKAYLHGGGTQGHFSMVISTSTDAALLARMFKEANPTGSYGRCVEALAGWIEALSWAYVPLLPDFDFGLFAAAKENTGKIADVRSVVHGWGYATYDLCRKEGRVLVRNASLGA